jgi:hypothetical protein
MGLSPVKQNKTKVKNQIKKDKKQNYKKKQKKRTTKTKQDKPWHTTRTILF